jgi:hypothetical protein
MLKTTLVISVTLVSAVTFADTPTDAQAESSRFDVSGQRFSIAGGGSEYLANPHVNVGAATLVFWGYEKLSGHLGLTYGMDLGYRRYSSDSAASQSVSVNFVSAVPTVRATYHAGSVMPFASMGIGYARAGARRTWRA